MKKKFVFLTLLVLSLALNACAGAAAQPTANAVPATAAPAQSTEAAPAAPGGAVTAPAAPSETVQAAPTGAEATGAAPEAPTAAPQVTDAAAGVTLAPNAPTLTVLTHDSFAATQSIVADFERANNVRLVFVKGGDAGAALNRAILTKDSPIADVFYGVDNTFLSRALDAGIYEPYNSPLLANISPEFKLDGQNRALPVDYGDVCINYDKAYFRDKNLPLPASLEDLAKPAYKGLLAMENPATSSPGLSFLLATIVHFGPDKYLDYWKQLRDNGMVVVNDWETAYYTNFSGSSGRGPQPMVVSYNSSPAAEVVYATTKLTEAPTGSIEADGTCFRQIEFVGIIKGTKQQALAQKFVDFMLSVPFQEDMPLQMFVYPVNKDAKTPDVFNQWSKPPANPATMDPAQISQNRDKWIQAWTETVLH